LHQIGQLTAKENRRTVVPFHTGKHGVAQLRDVPFTFVSPKGVVVRQNLT